MVHTVYKADTARPSERQRKRESGRGRRGGGQDDALECCRMTPPHCPNSMTGMRGIPSTYDVHKVSEGMSAKSVFRGPK